jgi:hypothetical protein
MELCEACKKTLPIEKMLQTPLGYFICQDSSECIAEFSGWNEPPVAAPGREGEK